MTAGNGDRLHDVVDAARNDHPDGDLPIVGRIGCVERTAARIETDFALQSRPEILLERRRIP